MNNLKQLVLSASGLWGERELSRIIRELKEMGPQADYVFVNSNYNEFDSNYRKYYSSHHLNINNTELKFHLV